jgi:hypothetical protein
MLSHRKCLVYLRLELPPPLLFLGADSRELLFLDPELLEGVVLISWLLGWVVRCCSCRGVLSCFWGALSYTRREEVRPLPPPVFPELLFTPGSALRPCSLVLRGESPLFTARARVALVRLSPEKRGMLFCSSATDWI